MSRLCYYLSKFKKALYYSEFALKILNKFYKSEDNLQELTDLNQRIHDLKFEIDLKISK